MLGGGLGEALTHGSRLVLAAALGGGHAKAVLGQLARGTPTAGLLAAHRVWLALDPRGQVLAGAGAGLPTGEKILATCTVCSRREAERVGLGGPTLGGGASRELGDQPSCHAHHLLGPSLAQFNGVSALRALPQRKWYACVYVVRAGGGGEVGGRVRCRGSKVRGSISLALQATTTTCHLCRNPHPCTEWNCPGRGDSACGPQGRAGLPQRWGASYMLGCDGTAPGTRHRETTVPTGSRLHPLRQKYKSIPLPWEAREVPAHWD